jgi:glycosyltransferase involved in cell wall biosynthesis
LHAFNRVLKANPNVRLLYVGPDESDGKVDLLKQTNPALFANVIDVGRVDNHEEYLAISNILCLPSYREGFGTIVIDAAALSIPTIGSRIVGLVDSIEDQKTGVLFPAGDIERLAELMLSFSRDEAATRQMGKLARARVEAHFTADRLYLALRDTYWRAFQESGGERS